jgi:hypothetical protein
MSENIGGVRGAELADDAHRPVLQISKTQNRELSYASCARGKILGESGYNRSQNISSRKELSRY